MTTKVDQIIRDFLELPETERVALASTLAASVAKEKKSAAEMRAASAVTNNDKPLAERIQAAAANPKKKEATKVALNLLKRLALPIEACESRETLNEALKGRSIDDRVLVKSALSFAGILQ